MSARAPSKPDPPGRTTHDDDTMLEKVIEGEAPDSTDSNVRYAAYASRARTILRSAHRYVAYTSDIGESFRPVAHPNWVRAAYGVSWLYLAGDVANEGYKAYVQNQEKLRGGLGVRDAPALGAPSDVALQPTGKVPFLEDYRAVMAQRAVFQSVASMGLPAFTIHSVVRYSGRALKDTKNKIIRTWGPIGLGLAIVPALPYMFDEPVEHAVDWAFEKGYELATGKAGTEKAKLASKEL
ncbi:mitochondrial 18 KDa protein-domain-containing protein [Geopyxis carbonaria]|nr:mitochondrial 18 KDa protein-domain-containing protein [Geopyxis carbonaria]